MQIPIFVPFFACFFGALTYDIFIYTGDSPFNNGSWSLVNFRNGVTHMWDNILLKIGRGPRRHRSDEERPDERQGQAVLTSTSLADKEGRKSSSPGRSDKHEKEGANEPNENTGSESNPKLKNTRKGGFHGEAWEKTESDSRPNQQSGGNREDHDKKDQNTPHSGNDTDIQDKETDENLEGKRDKETGYDNTNPDSTGNAVREEVDH